jgi:hypothetical protein
METNPPEVPENPDVTSHRIVTRLARIDRSKKWCAISSGMSESTFLRKLNGIGDWTLPELARIARALDVKPADLLPTEYASEHVCEHCGRPHSEVEARVA